MTLQLDMFQSAGVGVAALLLGMLFTRHIPFLKRFCIPAPVSGGLLISLLTLLLYALGLECSFDGTVKDLCMMLFFTSVGFQSDMKALRQGGKPLLVTEWSFPALDRGMPCTWGAGMRVKTQAERVQACELVAKTFLSCPQVVGYDYFMWRDQPAGGWSSSFRPNSQ